MCILCLVYISKEGSRQQKTRRVCIELIKRNSQGKKWFILTFEMNFQFVTDGEKPGGPPRNVRITGLASTSLEVTWDDPEQRLLHGIITRYNLGYREYK